MTRSTRHFYIGLYKKAAEVTGFASGFDPSRLITLSQRDAKADDTSAKERDPDSSALTFSNVISSFVSIMETYRKFIPLMLGMAPLLSTMLTERRIGRFAKEKGTLHNLSNEIMEIYELDISYYRQYVIHRDEVSTAFDGARHMPDVMIIGLVSAYDAFLSHLLRVIISRHQEIVLTSEKTIKFSELTGFASIEEARISLIDREIESVIRLSHHEQFDWMEKRFTIKLRENLLVWPEFVEICERRNLFTHTGGVVSKQYVDICQTHKCAVPNLEVGTKLSVNPEYYSNAVKVIYEIGAKLCHVLWRKFAPDQRTEADTRLNELGYSLIYTRAHSIAEPLLRFGTDVLKTHANDTVRRMMVVNLANVLRLQERTEEATKILNNEDWSACSDEFKICVAAVKGDLEAVVRLMKKIGVSAQPSKESYRTWPVFRGIRTEERFMTTFEKLFGESVIAPSLDQINVPEQTSGASATDEDAPTKH